MKPGSKEKSLNVFRRRAAVSLTEAVASLAVGGVLLAIAVVALGQVRGTDQRQVCLNNLRIISAASADYAQEDPGRNAIPIHARTFSYGAMSDYQYGGKSGRVNHSDDYRYTIERGFGAYTRPLNWRLYDVNDLLPPECHSAGGGSDECRELDKNLSLPLYRCPSDTGYTGLHSTRYRDSGRTSYDYFGTSYVASVLAICGPDMSSNSPWLRSLARVPNPGRTVHYMENCGRYSWAWGYGPWGSPTDFTVGGWHGQDWWFNVVFTDGHGDYLKIKGQGERIVTSPADVEFVAGLPGGMPVWWQVIIRGPKWQRDCLPSLPVPTGRICSLLLSGQAEDQGSHPRIPAEELTR